MPEALLNAAGENGSALKVQAVHIVVRLRLTSLLHLDNRVGAQHGEPHYSWLLEDRMKIQLPVTTLVPWMSPVCTAEHRIGC